MIDANSRQLNSQQACWLLLNQTPGLGPARLARLYQRFSSAEQLQQAPDAELLQAGLKSEQIEVLRRSRADDGCLEAVQHWLKDPLHHLITIESDNYPEQLKQIPDPPVVLFVRGDPEVLQFPQIAIVGSRNGSPQGLENAYWFSRELSNQGFIITSGLAMGIDARAHQGALAGKGISLAVLGTGINQIYPRQHLPLSAELVAQGGALVSEYMLGTLAKAYNFPRRNRIISGLSLGCLVVEASLNSGSLITARMAAEQGREVFALPGSIHNPVSRGCHRLIREGALLVDAVEQIYLALGQQLSLPDSLQSSEKKAVDQQCSEAELQLLNYLGFDLCLLDQLVEQSSLPVEQVSCLLLELELKGLVVNQAGGYQRISR